MESTTTTFLTPTEENKQLKEKIQNLEALVESLQSTILKQQYQLEGLIKRLYGRKFISGFMRDYARSSKNAKPVFSIPMK